MTDITDEQRAAYKNIDALHPNSLIREAFATLLPLLPSELTNPQPVLPTEPGVYGYEGGGTALTFLRTPTGWYALSDSGQLAVCDEAYITQAGMPLVPLVPERLQINRENIAHIVHLAKNGTQVVDDLLALVNGTDRD